MLMCSIIGKLTTLRSQGKRIKISWIKGDSDYVFNNTVDQLAKEVITDDIFLPGNINNSEISSLIKRSVF